MIIEELDLPGVHLVEFEPHEDHRGFFMRVYDDEIMEKAGLHRDWVQENHSYSAQRGTLRGLHFQYPPHAETKLIRVVNGEIFDVFVDLRENSPTFGDWEAIRISAQNRRMVYIPRGFAHGFCTLTEDCEIIYKVDNYYAPEEEGAIYWDDPDLGINWPEDDPITSDKDSKAGTFKEFIAEKGGLNVQQGDTR